MKKNTVLIAALIISSAVTGQLPVNTAPEVFKSLNNQKTANSKDILTTLFRASIDNLLGKEHSFTFNASFYGIDSIFRGKNGQKPSYEEERKLRRNSFNLSITGDSSNNITKFSGGFTLTIINKKDVVYTRFDGADSILLRKATAMLRNMKRQLSALMALSHPELGTDIDLKQEVDKSWREAALNNDYTKLHPFYYEALNDPSLLPAMLKDRDNIFTKEETEDAISKLQNGKNIQHETFKTIAEKYSRKPLWTFSPTAVYDRVNKQGEYNFSTEFTAGIGKNLNRKPLELEIKSQFKIANDTSEQKTNYNNKPFSISIGLNKVVMETEDNEPKMEFKFFTQYDYQFGNVPMGKKAGLFTLNSTFRVNVFKSMWLPITIKYDPENNNFLGLFSVTANLGN